MIGEKVLAASRPKPALWAAVALALGFGAALLAYRYVVLPFQLGDMHEVLIGVAVFTLVVGAGLRHQLRGTPRPAWPILAGAGLLGALLAVGLGLTVVRPARWMELRRYTLPAITVELPTTDPERESVDTEDAGNYDFVNAGYLRARVRVWWRKDAGALESLLANFASRSKDPASPGARPVYRTRDGHAPESVVLDQGEFTSILSRITCGPRMVTIVTQLPGDQADVEELHRRIIETVECRFRAD